MEKVLLLDEIKHNYITYLVILATSNVPGTTATISLLHKNMDLYIGHVVGLAISLVYDCMFFLPYVLQSCFFLKGDSRAMLCRGGVARRLTTDHCPSLLAEKVFQL